MNDWLTTKELADLALPGLPATRQGWDSFVEREGWDKREGLVRARQGKGGGLEYHVNILPPEALALYAARAIGRVDATDDSAHSLDDAQLPLPAVENRDARLALVAAAKRFARNGSLSQNTADRLFCALYNLEQLEVAPWVRAAVRRLSERSLWRWRRLAKSERSRLGVDRGAARRGKGALDAAEDGKVRAYILACVAHQPFLSADHVRELVGAQFPALALPSSRRFQQYLKGLKERERHLLIKVTNPDLYRSQYRVAGGNSAPVSRLNELWMIDASPADVLCVDGRHSIYVCVDIFSRRLSIYVSRTPRAEAVALLMRKAILAWGVPERVKTDNGSDFKAKCTQRLFASLDIEIDLAAPFSPEQKGHVERAIGTLQRDLMPLLPGFVGHSVAHRKVIEERKAFSARLGEDDAQAFQVSLTSRDLQDYCDRWAEDRYSHRPHSGLNGVTPFAQAASFAGRVRRIENERALDLLLAPLAGRDGLRVVGKQGVRIDGSFYLAPSVLPGTRVLVRMDPADMGRAFLFAPEGDAFLGEALCPALAGIDPKAAVAAAKAQQKQILEDGTRELRAGMRAIKPRDMAEAVLRRNAERAGNLVAFPRTADAHETPALSAAAEAMVEQPTCEISQVHSAAPEAAPVHRLPETKQQRFRRALALEKDVAAGVQISTEDALWLGGYQAGSEYQSMRVMFEDFGEAALK